MGNSIPSLNIIFHNIKKRLLKGFFEEHAKGLAFDWERAGDVREWPDKLFKAFALMGDREEWSNCCTQLFDLNAICNGSRKRVQDILFKRLDDYGQRSAMLKEVAEVAPSVYEIGMWIHLRMRDSLWKELVRETVNKEVEKGGGVTIHYVPGTPLAYETAIETFKREYKSFIERENSKTPKIHVEPNSIGVYNRYVMHVDPFPKIVPTFTGPEDVDDGWKAELDKNAESFAILDYPHDNLVRVKSDFSSFHANEIGEMFIRQVLGGEPCGTPKEKYDLSGYVYNPQNLEEKARGVEDFVSARYAGVTLKFNYPDGRKETVWDECNVGNVFDMLLESRPLDKYPLSQRDAAEIVIEVTVKSGYMPKFRQGVLAGMGDDDPRISRTYRVFVSCGKKRVLSCLDEHDLAVIDKCLDSWKLVDLNLGLPPPKRRKRRR